MSFDSTPTLYNTQGYCPTFQQPCQTTSASHNNETPNNQQHLSPPTTNNGRLQHHGFARAAPIQPSPLPGAPSSAPSSRSSQVGLKWCARINGTLPFRLDLATELPLLPGIRSGFISVDHCRGYDAHSQFIRPLDALHAPNCDRCLQDRDDSLTRDVHDKIEGPLSIALWGFTTGLHVKHGSQAHGQSPRLGHPQRHSTFPDGENHTLRAGLNGHNGHNNHHHQRLDRLYRAIITWSLLYLVLSHHLQFFFLIFFNYLRHTRERVDDLYHNY